MQSRPFVQFVQQLGELTCGKHVAVVFVDQLGELVRLLGLLGLLVADNRAHAQHA